MNVAFMGYRDWALKIFKALEPMRAILTPTDISQADVVLYYGWSEMIQKELYENKICLILHPSPLPKYRGGSPLQHQIINGEKESAVTILRASDKLDAGAIYSQTPFSLEGTLDEIFERIVDIAIDDTQKVLEQIERDMFYEDPKGTLQDETKATLFKRRKPEESELKIEDFKNKTSDELHNFIRALNDPYPNAFIRCKDGKKLYLTGSHL